MDYRVIIVGAGGMGRELFSAMHASGRTPHGFVDDAPTEETRACLLRLGATHLGPVDAVLTLRKPYIVAIGNPATRARIDRRLKDAGAITAPAVIDPSAVIGQDVTIGEGSIICARAIVTTNVRIGRSVIINSGCSVSHDTRLEDFATLAPMCSVCGHAVVKEGAELGAGACVLPRRIIEAWSIVGSGAVVTKDVPPKTVSVGVPARIMRAT